MTHNRKEVLHDAEGGRERGTYSFILGTQVYIGVIIERSGLGRVTWWPRSLPAFAAFAEPSPGRLGLRLGRLANDGDDGGAVVWVSWWPERGGDDDG